jgi:hypothetical protein
MPIKSPFDYDLAPREIEAGVRWLTLRLGNIGEQDLHDLSVRLNSLDTYQIDVYGTGSFVEMLQVDEFQGVPFQVMAQGTTRLYATVDGTREDEDFHWESPGMRVVVGLDIAELVSLFALTEPYPTIGTSITVEAVIRGLAYNEGLGLEFWAETPDLEMISLAKMPTDPVPEGETARYTAAFTPDQEGIYTLYTYLFAGNRRIDIATEYLSITR